jgi:general secretion pathway protein M
MKAGIRAFWQDRTPRERVLMALAAAVLAAALIHTALWQPLSDQRGALHAAIADHAAAEQYLVQGGVVQAAPAFPDPAANQPLATRLTQSAQGLGLTVRRLDPAGPGAADVTLDEAPFDLVMAWLIELERDRGLDLLAFTLTRRPAPGAVAATVSVGE